LEKRRRKKMKKLSILIIAAILVLSTANSFAAVPAVKKVPVIIGFKDDQDTALIKGQEGEIEHVFTLINAMSARLPENVIEKLRKNPKIAYVEPDYVALTLAESTPWGVGKINASKVWQMSTSNKGTGIKIAVLDTGIQNNHPDLQKNLRGGVNFAGFPSGSTISWHWTDKNGHGTHVAGTIGAVGNNGIGVIGVAPEAHLYAVKVLGDSGSGYYSWIINGIQWSVNNNMNVISMSLGGTGDSQALKDAVDNARAKGVVVVAAAGNSGDRNPLTNNILYPAKYDSVIAVGATDSNDAVATWSSDGSEIDVSAPGVSILSTYKGSSYATMSGTSMATPHVSGTVALMLKAGVRPDDIKSKLQSTAFDISPAGFDVFSGYGRIDALKGVQ
jgi:subtilisin